LVEEADDGMFITDLHGRYLAVNPWGTELTGYSREELLGMNITDLIPPEDPVLEPIRMDDLRQGNIVIKERRIYRKNGSVLPVEVRVRTLPTGNLLVIMRDTAVRTRAQEALLESEKRYRSVVEDQTELICRFLPEDGTLTFVNEAYCRYFDKKVDELVGHSFLSLIPELERGEAWSHIAALTTVNSVMTHEHPVLLPDGTQGWQQWTNRAILDESGARILEIQAVGRDITVRKRAEEQMLIANERLQYLLSSTSVVIYTAKSSGNYGTTFISGNVAQMVGYDSEEFIGDSRFWYDRVHPEDRVIVLEEVPRVLEGEPHAYEYRFKCRDGRYIWVRDEMKLVRDRNGNPLEIIGFWLDVTDRKLAEEEGDKLRVQLLQAQKMESVGRLAGGLAHDFNNLLSVILGHAELAMTHCSPSESIRADLKDIQNAAQRSADLIQKLLAFARKQTVLPQVLDLNHTLAGMLKMLQRLIGEDIDIIWIPGAGLWPVKIDPSQIDQIITNLCVNARDAITGVGKVTIETENTVFDDVYCAVHQGSACGEYVTLTVNDTGCGIRKEDIDYVFEPFFTTKDVGKGTGLGLATVYGIVRQNGGFINVQSEADKGTTFKISLPRFAGEAVEPAAESAAETPRGRGETVLLVEDDAATLKVGRAMLEGLGYTVLTAGMPGEALRQAEAHAAEIRLLITDVIMPEMNGRALAKLIGDIKPGLKCLFISGYTSDIVARHGVLDEGVCFLQKPFSLRELASKVRQAFECE